MVFVGCSGVIWFLHLSVFPFFHPQVPQKQGLARLVLRAPRARAVLGNAVAVGAPLQTLRGLAWVTGFGVKVHRTVQLAGQSGLSPWHLPPSHPPPRRSTHLGTEPLSPHRRWTQYLSHPSGPALWRTGAPFFRLGNQGSERPCHFCGKRSWSGFCPSALAQVGQLPLGPGVLSVQRGSCTLGAI